MTNFKNTYKYVSWDKETFMDKVMFDLEELYEKGWIVLSHSQNQYGISVILINKELKCKGKLARSLHKIY